MKDCTDPSNHQAAMRGGECTASRTLGVDVRCLAERYRTGVGEVAYQVLKRLPRLMPQWQLRYFSHARSPVRIPELEAPNVTNMHLAVPSKIFNAAVRAFGRPRIDRILNAEAVFLPSLQSVAVRPTARLAVTVHDLSFERYPEFFSPRARLWHRLVNPRRLCQRAGLIIAVSRHTKAELVERYGVPEEKIAVCHLGVGEEFFQPADAATRAAVRQRYRLPERYVLTLGNLEPRKNFSSVLVAFSRLAPDCDLVVVGRPVWQAGDLERQVEALPARNRIRLIGYVRAQDRPAIYQMAACFVYPSYYEGFGLPALEAMASGVPVVASNATALPEVVGDAGILVDPYDVADLAEAMDAVLGSAALQARYRAMGQARSKIFSWDRTAEKIARALARLA